MVEESVGHERHHNHEHPDFKEGHSFYDFPLDPDVAKGLHGSGKSVESDGGSSILFT